MQVGPENFCPSRKKGCHQSQGMYPGDADYTIGNLPPSDPNILQNLHQPSARGEVPQLNQLQLIFASNNGTFHCWTSWL